MIDGWMSKMKMKLKMKLDVNVNVKKWKPSIVNQ